MNDTEKMTAAQKQLTEAYLYLVPVMINALTRSYSSLSPTEHEELMQVGSLALCRAAMRYDGIRPFKTYAQVVIKHAIYDYWRSTANHQKMFCSLDATISDEDERTYEQLLADETHACISPEQELLHTTVSAYLGQLEKESCPMIQKGIASLRLQQQKGYTSSDLAKLYGVPSNRIRAWQSKARKMLKKDTKLYALLA